MSAKPIDLSIIKEGLEYAQFKDFRIRDAMSEVLKQLQLDLEDVGFEPAPATQDAIAALEEMYLTVETEGVKLKRPSSREDDSEVIESRPNNDIIEEDDDIETRPKTLKVVQK